jgi:predicted MPP superfamily phosphohydrolase
MTPERFVIAVLIFHAAAIAVSVRAAKAWRAPSACRQPWAVWLRTLMRDLLTWAASVGGLALAASVIANVGELSRLRLGSIAGRLMGQALFGEAILLGAALSTWHRRAARPGRAAALALGAVALFAVYVDAYRIEPHLLRVRWHVVDGRDPLDAPGVRILHITDIQTSRVGGHEECALRTGLAYGPDLIVLTGDYVQDSMGRRTEERAKEDLRALRARVHFAAPLGVYATEGDAGLPCGNVFAGTPVRCLVDESVRVELPGGGDLSLTGLSARHGRIRDRAWLASLLARAPRAGHRIVISHAPDFVDSLPEHVDLVLAGHTHGGQVVLPLLGPPRTASRLPRLYAGGLHDYRGTWLHVSRGVGMERGFAPPLRFLCPPEICLLDVRLR